MLEIHKGSAGVFGYHPCGKCNIHTCSHTVFCDIDTWFIGWSRSTRDGLPIYIETRLGGLSIGRLDVLSESICCNKEPWLVSLCPPFVTRHNGGHVGFEWRVCPWTVPESVGRAFACIDCCSYGVLPRLLMDALRSAGAYLPRRWAWKQLWRLTLPGSSSPPGV